MYTPKVSRPIRVARASTTNKETIERVNIPMTATMKLR
jgi:hypothetical protein